MYILIFNLYIYSSILNDENLMFIISKLAQ